VCGDRPQRCDPVRLNAEDLEVVTLNTTALSDDLREMLALSSPSGVASDGNVLVIGTLPLLAGIGLAVFMVFPSDGRRIEVRDLPILPLQLIGGLLLTPTGELVEALPEPWFAIALADLISTDLASSPTLMPAGERHLDLIKDKTRSAFEKSDTAAWRLPMDATWGELEIEFISDAVLNARFRSQTRRMEPEHLGMKDGRTGDPNEQWALLWQFAKRLGALPSLPTKRHDIFVKQKQELSKRLRFHFGIPDEPIVYDRRLREFRTAFVLRPHALRRGQDEFSSSNGASRPRKNSH
jgi:hypothetical protein